MSKNVKSYYDMIIEKLRLKFILFSILLEVQYIKKGFLIDEKE